MAANGIEARRLLKPAVKRLKTWMKRWPTWYKLRENGVSTKAMIIDRGKIQGRVYYIICQYTANETTYTKELVVEAETFNELPPGSTVDVVYLPYHAHIATLATDL
jgi:hypothetical protein